MRSAGLELGLQGGFPVLPGPPFHTVSLAGHTSLFPPGQISLAVLPDLLLHARNRISDNGFLELTFPDDDNGPAFRLQLSPHLLVPFPVPSDLGRPELSIGLGNGVTPASIVAVPEASVHEYDRTVFRKNDVRCTREPLVVHPIAETRVPQRFTQPQLRLRGRRMNGGHGTMALFKGEGVGHVTGALPVHQVSRPPFRTAYTSTQVRPSREYTR